MTSDDTAIQDQARERLFDAELGDAVRELGAGGGAASSRRAARLARAALLLLGIAVTFAVLVLRDRRVEEAQEPHAFDPLFPRVENEWLWGHKGVGVHTQAQLDALPERGPAVAIAHAPEAAERLARQPGVRKLHLAPSDGVDVGADDLPPSTWRAIGRMPDLEMLSVGGAVTAAALRELRHAPRLQAVMFSPGSVFDEALATSLVELPHLSCVMFLLTEIRPGALARLRGLPGLRALYFESCRFAPSWLEEVGTLRTLRWLRVADAALGDAPPRLLARDLRHLERLSRLESFQVAGFAMDDEALRALPASAAVLGLRLAEPLGVEGLRALGERETLRGLLLGKVARDAEAVVNTVLSRRRLQRFGREGRLAEATWTALDEAQTVRRLAFETARTNAEDLARCARLADLEQLDLVVAGFPGPYDLSPLRSLQRLRRVTISDASGRGGPSATDVESMRASLAPAVELVVRH